MTTLAEHIIIAGARNRPPMLEKINVRFMDKSYTSIHQMEENGRMMLDSIDNGPLVYPIVEENEQTRPKKYSELTEAQQFQDDYDVQETNIILHVFHPMYTSLAVPTFQQRENLIYCINKAMAFLSALALRFPPLNNQLRMSSNLRNHETIQDGRVTVQEVQGRQTQSFDGNRNREIDATSRGNYETSQTEDLDAYDSDCDDISSAKAVLMANLSSCDPDVLFEISYSDSYPNDMIN
uniref:Uncharacterized protein n=1 Tax=Tanacetum cinerariifolium TaxID=118510 RepID=A0A6L2N6H2_TANCI|nr:hypothetical protein [Tanacetum cinerariifolium]